MYSNVTYNHLNPMTPLHVTILYLLVTSSLYHQTDLALANKMYHL